MNKSVTHTLNEMGIPASRQALPTASKSTVVPNDKESLAQSDIKDKGRLELGKAIDDYLGSSNGNKKRQIKP